MEEDKEKYYDYSKKLKPDSNVLEFLKLNIEPKMAIDLGCGAGRDTIALIKHNWNVLAIDKEDTESIIREQLSEKEQKKFKFQKSLFGSMKLPSSNLIVANYSLPFAKKEYFKLIWNKINSSLLNEGYYVGNFFGKNDSWIDCKRDLMYLSENEVRKLFINFEIIQFNEIEMDGNTAIGEEKHWHLYDVIAKKIR